MFKKLKEKIEEVKSSPQRIQQLTQSVTDKFQNSTVSEDNFFSLGDEDSNAVGPPLEPGFSNVSLTSHDSRLRRNSNSSIASDVSFLPRYESSPNMYHLQSDLDVSASEVEDNASTSSQLGNISKEQVYSAFQKAQMQYHKYRGRYTDLAKHYRELEREIAKLKSVLVDTQDKALRRAAELREQCNLEQKAKAHLENALRVELDERQYKIETLQTQISLLHSTNTDSDVSSEQSAKIQSENASADLELLTKYLNDARAEIESLNGKLQETKANAIIFQSKEVDYKTKIAHLEKELSQYSEREKENNLKLAQSKMELHNEIIAKDSEISKLKLELEAAKQDQDNKAKDSLQIQNKKLIEKLESLTQKCNKYESELLKIEQYKIEIKNLTEEIAKSKHTQEIETLQKDKADLESKCKQFAAENADLHAELTQARDELSKTADELEQSKEAVTLLKHAIETKEKECNKKIEEQREQAKVGLLSLEIKVRDKLGKEYAEKEEKLRTEFLHKVSSLTSNEDHLRETQMKLFEKEDRVKHLEEENDQQKQRLQALQSKYQELEENHLELINESAEQRNEISELQKQISYLEETNVGLQEEITHVKTNIARLEGVLTQLRNEKQQLQQEKENLDNLQKDYNEKQNEILSLHDKIQSLESRITDLSQKEDAFDKLTRQHGETEKLVKNLDENIVKEKEICDNLEKELALFKNQDNDLHLENTRLKEQIVDLKKQVDASNLENLNSIKSEKDLQNELTNKLQMYESEVSLKNNELKNLQTKLQELEEKCTESKQLLSKQANDIKDFEEKYLGVLDQNQKLQEQVLDIQELHTKISELEGIEAKYKKVLDENRQFLTSTDQYKAEIETLKQEKVQFEAAAEKMRQDVIKLSKTELEKIQKLETDHRDVVKQKSIKLKTVETQLAAATEENDHLKAEIKALQNRISEIYSENSDLYASNARLKELEGKHDALLRENEELRQKQAANQGEIDEIKRRNSQIALDNETVHGENSVLLNEVEELKIKLDTMQKETNTIKEKENEIVEEKQQLTQELEELKLNLSRLQDENNELKKLQLVQVSLEDKSSRNQLVLEETKLKLESLIAENTERNTSMKSLENTQGALLKEKNALKTQLAQLENQYSELLHEKQLLQDEIQELKTSPLNLNHNHNIPASENTVVSDPKSQNYVDEIKNLHDKLIQYQSMELTTRSSLEFYHGEIEKLKSKNEKLNRDLDETIVTLNHCADLSSTTEIEYLRNVLYNYMLGKESLVLARVIAAVCKFDEQQTEAILQKEQQKQTLLGQLGIL